MTKRYIPMLKVVGGYMTQEKRVYLVKQTQEAAGYVNKIIGVFASLAEAKKCTIWHNAEYGLLNGEALPKDFDIWRGPEDGWGASDHFYTIESITVSSKWNAK